MRQSSECDAVVVNAARFKRFRRSTNAQVLEIVLRAALGKVRIWSTDGGYKKKVAVDKETNRPVVAEVILWEKVGFGAARWDVFRWEDANDHLWRTQ